MDQQKRLLIAIALSFGLTLIFTNFVWKPAPAPDDSANAAALDAGVDVTPVAASAPSDPALAQFKPAIDETEKPPTQVLHVESPTTRFQLTTEGAVLTSAVLTGERERAELQLTIPQGYQKLLGKSFEAPAQINLASPGAAMAPQLGISITGDDSLPANTPYSVVQNTSDGVVLKAVRGPWEVVKTFKFPQKPAAAGDPSGYVSSLEVTIRNRSGENAAGQLVVHTARAIEPGSEEAPSMFGGIGNQAIVLCRVGDSVTRKTPDNDSPKEDVNGLVSYVGIDQQYFLTAVWPTDQSADGRCALTSTQSHRQADLSIALSLKPNETITKKFGAFMGPKDLNLLLNIAPPSTDGSTPSVYNPMLDTSVDFGIWAFICKALIVFLRVFHSVTGNWGWAIILLTVMVKLLLLPLTHKAMVSAEQMKKLQPKMEEIRKKFPEDREKQNQEMMALYQQAKVNPLGGCLPLLLQLPIWAALFTTLRTSYELYGEPFYGVWSDLTSKDPTYLLPVALGVTMIVTQRLQPQMMDQSQAFMMTWVMPIFFTALMMNYPAGLSLYIFTNNLLSIVQQFALRRILDRNATQNESGRSPKLGVTR